MRDEVLAELGRQRRLVTARYIATRLDADLDDVHAALLELQTEGLAAPMTDHQALMPERWGTNRAPKEKP